MSARQISLPLPAPILIGTAALLSALLAGMLTAANVPLGLAFAVAVCYGAIVLLNLPLGVVLWVVLIFVEYLAAVSVGPFAAGILLAFGWVGTLRERRAVTDAVFAQVPRLPVLIVLLLGWSSLSLIYARDSRAAWGGLWSWGVAMATLVLIATTIDRVQRVRWLVVAFATGACLSVALGLGAALVSGGLGTQVTAEGRLQGGGADPNYFAAGLVAALVLVIWLATHSRRFEMRWLAALGAGLVVIGIAASQSRGALVGIAAVAVTSLLVYRGRRLQIAGIMVVLVAVASVYFVGAPGAWQRVSNFSGGGTGREDVWTVALRVAEAHPVAGVGLQNFPHYSAQFTREPGVLKRVDIIEGHHAVVHNSYLQMLAETGFVGLGLFLALVVYCMRAMLQAAREFSRRRDRLLDGLARAVLIATTGLLASSFFISNGPDKRLWVLLALGPVLLAIARSPVPGQVAAAAISPPAQPPPPPPPRPRRAGRRLGERRSPRPTPGTSAV